MLALSVLSLAAVAVAAPIRFATILVAQNMTYTNVTQLNAASWYTQNGTKGACGEFSRDLDMVVGLGLEFYNTSDVNAPKSSSFCGSYITVKNPINNATVVARVADASGFNNTLAMSVASWRAIEGDETKMQNVTWFFSNDTEIAAAVAYAQAMVVVIENAPDVGSTQAIAATPSSTFVAPSATEASTTSTDSASSLSPEAPTSTYVAPTSTYVAPSSTYVARSSSYVAPSVAPTSAAPTSGQFSGRATYYTQEGGIGSCGNANSDSAFIVAVSAADYDASKCGQSVRITRPSTGKSITAVMADKCPGCASGSLDLSVAAYNVLGTEFEGTFAMTYTWI